MLLVPVAGCGGKSREASGTTAPGGSPTPEPGAVATIGGEAVSYRSFERYLADNAMDDAGEDEQEDVIKSRLLDQFLEEQLLLRAAAKLKMTVSEAEIDSYLQQIGVTEGEADAAGSDGRQAFRDKVRQGLLVQKVKDEAVLSKVQVTPGEIEDAIRKQPDAPASSRMVVLRQILVDDRRVANRLHAAIAADPARFEALARESSVAPDKGQARSYSEEELPVELREQLFALQPGQTSPVIENAQRFLIFQLVRKEEPRPADPQEFRSRVRLDLFQKKGDQALERFVADLKSETEIRVNRSVMPFKYIGEYKN